VKIFFDLILPAVQEP